MMFCKNCGKEIEDGKELCDVCAASANTTTAEPEIAQQVYTNGEAQDTTTTTTTTTESTTTQTTQNPEAKSKLAAGLLGIFLGSFGVHNFYLGYTGKAIAQVLITVLTCGIGAAVTSVWGLIEGILILTGSINTDGKGNPLKD